MFDIVMEVVAVYVLVRGGVRGEISGREIRCNPTLRIIGGRTVGLGLRLIP
jgi:hypothetical protein